MFVVCEVRTVESEPAKYLLVVPICPFSPAISHQPWHIKFRSQLTSKIDRNHTGDHDNNTQDLYRTSDHLRQTINLSCISPSQFLWSSLSYLNTETIKQN